MSDCPVCVSPYNLEIASMAACGATAEVIATSTGLDVDAIENHLAICCAAPVPDDTPDSLEKSDQRLRGLASKIAAAGTASGLAGDAKSLLAALAIELRVETALRARLEKQEEKSAGALPGEFSEEESSRYIHFVDSVLEETAARRDASPQARWGGMQKLLAEHPLGAKITDLVWRLLHDGPLLDSILPG